MAKPGLRLLCLDGGGVRGLASLYMLKQLLSHSGDQKPCHFFDMIAGTSTGGLIAIMLGVLEMTVDDCIEAFIRLMGSIFAGGRTVPFHFINGKVRPRYNTANLEAKIREVIIRADLPADARMRHNPSPTCKTFVVALSAAGGFMTRFTNYKKPDEMSNIYDNVKIWEAARATSAATTFFEEMVIDGSRYVDGGAGANNPVNQLWREASDEFGTDFESRLRCLLSIGTGLPAPSDFGVNIVDVTRSLIAIATETHETHRDFYANHSRLVERQLYFRFNPPYLDEVGMDQPRQRALIHDRTERYVGQEDVKLMRRQFQQSAGSDMSARAAAALRPVVTGRTRKFYNLTGRPEHIRSEARNYWQHLTLLAYKIYEEIVEDCRRHRFENQRIECKSKRGSRLCMHFTADRATVTTFIECFNPGQSPPPAVVENVWRRLLRNKSRSVQTSGLAPGLVMACLYVLHIEEKLGRDCGPPRDLDGPTEYRREALKRYDRWVECDCPRNCGRTWNFANDIGLSRGGDAKRSCDIENFLNSSSTMALFKKSAAERVKKLRTTWEQPRSI